MKHTEENEENEINEFQEQFMSGWFNSPEDLMNDFAAFAKATGGKINPLEIDKPVTLQWKAAPHHHAIIRRLLREYIGQLEQGKEPLWKSRAARARDFYNQFFFTRERKGVVYAEIDCDMLDIIILATITANIWSGRVKLVFGNPIEINKDEFEKDVVQGFFDRVFTH